MHCCRVDFSIPDIYCIFSAAPSVQCTCSRFFAQNCPSLSLSCNCSHFLPRIAIIIVQTSHIRWVRTIANITIKCKNEDDHAQLWDCLKIELFDVVSFCTWWKSWWWLWWWWCQMQITLPASSIIERWGVVVVRPRVRSTPRGPKPCTTNCAMLWNILCAMWRSPYKTNCAMLWNIPYRIWPIDQTVAQLIVQFFGMYNPQCALL